MFESDGWLDWDPDPERAARDAVPTLEPYASMSRPQLLELMMNAKGGREWEFLQEYFLNQCSEDELAVGTEEFIKTQYSVFDFEEMCYLEGAVELALQRRNRLRADGRGPHSAGPSGDQYSFPISDTERINPITHVPIWDKSG